MKGGTKTVIRTVFWASLLISALLAFPGIQIRFGNELSNKSVITVVDYGEFQEAANKAHIKLDDILAKFKDLHAATIAVKETSPGIGFDEKLLTKLKDKGFDILLRPADLPYSNTEYLDRYKKIIQDFGARYIIFSGNEVAGYPKSLNALEQIISQNNMIVGVIEAPSQVGIVGQKGLDEIMPTLGYPVNRVYIVPDNDLTKLSAKEMYYRWNRCVVDRNIRFIYVRPLENSGLSYIENINNTIASVSDFQKFISSKGYEVDKPLVKLSAAIPCRVHYIFVALSLVFAMMLYILYLFAPKNITTLILTVCCIALSVILNMLNMDMAKILALLASVLYPSLSSLLFLRYLKKSEEKSLIIKMLFSLLILLGVNAIGMYTVVTALADIRYTMGIDTFIGVDTAYIAPLVLFILNFISCFVGYKKLKGSLKRILNFKITFLTILGIFAALFAIYLYLGRSIFDTYVTATGLELKVREILESIMVARPRFKEFLVGYPALFALVYLYPKYKKTGFVFAMGAGVTVGCVSMVNSFCHVFTAITVSIERTLNGLVVGVVIGMALVIMLWAVKRIMFLRK